MGLLRRLTGLGRNAEDPSLFEAGMQLGAALGEIKGVLETRREDAAEAKELIAGEYQRGYRDGFSAGTKWAREARPEAAGDVLR